MIPVVGSGRGRQHGGTFVGLIVGLLLGLGIAVVVALFVTQGQLPFVNKVMRATERAPETKAPAELPDPNKPLLSKDRPAPAPAEPVDGATKPGAAEGKPAESRPADEPRAVETPEAGRDERSAFLLQAGSFRTLEDAEGMRARLALLGYEARVLSADVNGQTVYRVRLGPFAKVDDVNQAKSRLADNGIESAVMRQR
jgi:cell division protein FtsN